VVHDSYNNVTKKAPRKPLKLYYIYLSIVLASSKQSMHTYLLF